MYENSCAQSDDLMRKTFSVKKMKSALLAIEHEMTPQQRQMLMTHYAAKDRTASMEQIARFGDYSSYSAANIQYGRLAGKIAEQLGYRSPGNQTYTIATHIPERNAKNHHQWRMDDTVAKALEQLGWVSPSDEVSADAYDYTPELRNLPETEHEALVKARKGQGIFRNEVVALFSGCCAVTGCNLSQVLVASHIVPWKDATNAERLDPFNGLLLTPNLDRLFDKVLISFNNDGSMLLSTALSAEMRIAMGVSDGNKLRFLKPEMLPYLRRHRQLFFETEGR